MSGADLRLIDMPADGLYRVAREDEVGRFPPPLARPSESADGPLLEGYRWEDVDGHFGTLKFSRAKVGAVGRAVASYRERRLEDGRTIVEHIDEYESSESDDDVSMPARCIPSSFFERMVLQHLTHREDVYFVDLAHQRTLEGLQAETGAALRELGVTLNGAIWMNRDRRVTSTLVRALYDLCALDDERIAGLRYPGTSGRGWDAFVVWEPPGGGVLRLDDADIEEIEPGDPAVKAACRTLGLDLPRVSS